MFQPKVFFVDDEPGILAVAARIFRRTPVVVRCFSDGLQALSELPKDMPAAIVSDNRMPGMNGIELLEQCRRISPNTTRILLTGFIDIDAAVGAINRGSVYRFLSKPWDDDELRAGVFSAVAESVISNATKALSSYQESLIGVESPQAAVELLGTFIDTGSGFGLAPPELHEDPASDPHGEDGGLLFSCPFGVEPRPILVVRVAPDEAAMFGNTGYGQTFESIVGTSLHGCRIAVEAARARSRLLELSEHDPLTGLLNRRAMEARLENEFERKKRYGGNFSVLLIDIDSFKSINDTYGHAKGDAVISGIGGLMSRTSRSLDIVARLGGDEFLVALPETDAGNAALVAARIQSLTRALGKELELNEPLTLSIGVAFVSERTGGVEQLIAEADAAMYAVKKSGKNAVG